MSPSVIFQYIFLLTAILISGSCTNQPGLPDKEMIRNENHFLEIDYTAILKNKEVVRLSNIASDIEYVSLETNDSCLLHRIADYHFTDDYIFVDNSTHILKFDWSGKFIRKIGKPGRGPGEIGLIRMVSVLEEEKMLVVQTNWARRLYFFSFEGEFIETKSIPDMYRILALSDHRYIYFDQCIRGDNEYMFALIDKLGDTLDVVNNHYKWENTKRFNGSVHYDHFNPFYFYSNILSFKSMHNDTVFSVVGDSLIPEYFISLGDYKLPQEFRAEVINEHPRDWMKEFNRLNKGFWYASVFQAGNNLFITSCDYADENQRNLIYQKDINKGKLVVDIHNYPGEITNDIDGGLDFWPIGSVNDSTVFMPIPPYQLLAIDTNEKLTGDRVSDRVARAKFQTMLSELSENDNPVLMLVKLSKK